LLRPSVQLPAGIHGCAVYKDFEPNGKEKRHDLTHPARAGRNRRRLDITGFGGVFRPDFGDFRRALKAIQGYQGAIQGF